MTPMNLTQMFFQAQNGEAVANMAKQFGISEEQAAEAVRQVLPAFSAGFQRNTADPLGMAGLMAALSGGRHAQYFEDASTLSNSATRDDGNAILGHLFGSPEVSRAVAQHAASQAGLGSAILKAMLPYIASIIMGAIFKKGQGPLGDILGEMMGGGPARADHRREQPEPEAKTAPANDPFGPLSEIFKQQFPGMPGQADEPVAPDLGTQPRSETGGGTSKFPGADAPIFRDMFEAEGNRSPFEDILRDMLGGGRR